MMLTCSRLIRAVPSPLIAISLLTAIVVTGHINVPTLSQKGHLAGWSIPSLAVPNVPFTLETLRLIAPYAVAVALVGLLESLMTAQLVDELTGTSTSAPNRECVGQGAANIITAALGGMGGCAMIGQTIINVKSGGRTRVSTFSAGMSVFVLVGLLGPVLGRVPIAALVAVMIVVSFSTFDWNSVRPATLRRLPKTETAVMLVTVVTTVATSNLAVGVIAGVLLASLLFAWRLSSVVDVTAVSSSDGTRRTYAIAGQLFFASSSRLPDLFDYDEDPDHVILDLGGSHVWDASTIATLDSILARYSSRGKRAELANLSASSARIHQQLSGTLGPGG